VDVDERDDDLPLLRVIDAAANLVAARAALSEARAAGIPRSQLAQAAGRTPQWVSWIAPTAPRQQVCAAEGRCGRS
jgi:hypothetical protein